MKHVFWLLVFIALGVSTCHAAHCVDLSWGASPDPVVGYNVYRSTVSGGPYTLLNSTPVTALTYSDSAVTAGTKYFYVVRAELAGVESVNSNEASATVPIAPPVALAIAGTK